ncbi:nucleotidyltransferase family protein [Croceibacterium aestuarii]|uniref:nucleotidyltransferase family protein n=1 Tax=Croceibacterium aestuarii TaxID=3064139 RepID=UPI00272E346B|nr:nucleotidyltransferase family protein [Croceibacterium sp. D39]
MTPPVLILAGSRPNGLDSVAAAEGVPHKVLARVGETTLLERVVVAARAYGASEVLVAANHPEVEDEVRRLGATLLPTASGPSESVALAFERTGAPLLVTTADHALLEPGWLAALVAGTPPDTDVSLMLARRAAVETAAPGSKRTWLSLADGDWSGCNLFFLATPTTPLAIAAWRRVEADRKRPWRIAARLGWGTLWNFLTGRLTMAQAVERIGRRIGIVAALVEAPDGRAAIDVDKPADLALVRALADPQK